MRIIKELGELREHGPISLAIGNFDGVHRGHQRLLLEMLAAARRAGQFAGVLTFRPHPRIVLQPDAPLQFLTTPPQQRALLADLGVDVLIEQPFTRALADTPAEEYIADVVRALDLRDIWVGDDFNFGKDRAGNVALLRDLGRQLGFAVHIVDRHADDGPPASSTRIRAALRDGDVGEAARLLGRSYELFGTVIHGDQRGRQIGVPTANVQPEAHLAVPAHGVYACTADAGGVTWPAATNIGTRPTVDGSRVVVEAHLIGFDGDLYDQHIAIRFLSRIRDERRFERLDDLVTQIHADIDAVRKRVSG